MNDPMPPAMSGDEAREFVAYIRQAQDEIPARVIEAYQRRAWLALGYASWDAMCTGEDIRLRLPRDERQQMTMELRSAGMSTRAIGSTLAVDHKTVVNDARGASTGENSPVDLPDKVMSLDGRERPASRPATPLRSDEEGLDTEVAEDDPDSGSWVSAADALARTHPQPHPAPESKPGLESSRRPARRPLPEFASDAGWELRKAVDRIERVLSDDRYPRNQEQVTAAVRGHLLYTVETCQQFLDQLNTDQ